MKKLDSVPDLNQEEVKMPRQQEVAKDWYEDYQKKKEENEKLRKELVELKQEVEKLKEQLNKLNQRTSENSSQPPSSDAYKKKVAKTFGQKGKKKENGFAKLLLIWDGASYHRGEEMKKFLEEQNEELEEEEWKVRCQRFAPYAPEENPVEAIWLQLKTLLRRCYRFGKNFKIVKYLFQMFVNLKLFNLPDLKKYDAFSRFV